MQVFKTKMAASLTITRMGAASNFLGDYGKKMGEKVITIIRLGKFDG